MRITILLALLAACSPDIASGAYLCGPEQLCPATEACNAPDNTCVSATAAEPFACAMGTQVEPDNDLTTAQDLGMFQCVSQLVEVNGCLPSGDTEDWYKLAVPSNCSSVELVGRIVFPIAFQSIEIGIDSGDGTHAIVSGNVACPASGGPNEGNDQLCFKLTVAPGSEPAVRVMRSGNADCGGQCDYNRYTLALQLDTPS